MPAVNLPNLGVGVGVGGGAGEGLRGASGVQRAAFEDAMRNTQQAGPAASPVSPVPAAQAQPAQPVAATGFENDAASRERVRRSLELNGTQSSDGDAILGGLQRLRGFFDARHTRIGEIMNSNTVDTNALLAMQMEVAQYSLLVDVSSKLTGKTTQSLDTLMKGQ